MHRLRIPHLCGMIETILKVDGMMCGMCESHVNETVRKTADVKKVTSSHTKGETVILSEQELDIDALKANTAIAQLMIYVNALSDQGGANKAEYELLLQLLVGNMDQFTDLTVGK